MEFWVSANGTASGNGTRENPFATIEAAQAAVRAVLASSAPLASDITVHIGGGTYQLSQPLTFTDADSGRDGHVVRYQAVAGEHPVISGGQAVTGWTAVSDPHLTLASGTQLWEANVGLGVDSAQLYVDGVRATVAESNSADIYPEGFRPTYYDLPGVSGIQYAVDSSNGTNWQDPTTWTNVSDISAVVYTQWKMMSVPLTSVAAPSSSIPSLNPVDAPTVGLISLLDPAWTNANLIRSIPTGTSTSDPFVITLDGTLAATEIQVGMTVAITASGNQQDLGIITGVDPVTNQISVSLPAILSAGTDVTLSIIDPLTGEQVLGQPNEWSFWRVTKFINAYQFMDEAGEWYLDRSTGKIYLVTKAGDNPNNHDVQLPVQETLISGNGASNLTFDGLTFQYATWLDAAENGYVSDQAGFHLTGSGHEVNQIGHFEEVTRTPGNLSFVNGTGITFSNNVFAHLGGAALDFSGGAQDNSILNNIFKDISSAAIQIGGVNAEDARPATDEGITRNNVVDGNVIQNIGVDYIDVPAIFLGYSQNSRISNNYIADVPWSGISIGWGWGLRDQWLVYDPFTGTYVDMGSFPGLDGALPGQWGDNTTPTIMGGNEITGNTITRFLQVAWDGGAIYTTGFQDGNPFDIGLDGTVIANNYAYDKASYAGGNVFYTDGGSRFLELINNISFGNAVGTFNFGPLFSADDPLNANNPFKVFPEGNSLSYGSDIGGCVTFGDILYVANRWENWWLANVFSENPSAFPFNPLYYDPGRRGTTFDPWTDTFPLPGAPYPANLEFLGNIQVSGWWGAPLQNVSVNDVLAFVRPTALSATRDDALGGVATFGLQSLDDASIHTVLENAASRSAAALSYDGVTHAAWLASEGQAVGTMSTVPGGQMGAGVWLPVAMVDGQALALTELHADGNSAHATFEGGYEFTFTLGGSRSIATGVLLDQPTVTVQRLAAFENGLAFYEADQSTGQITYDGQTYLPGDEGYLAAALALAEGADLVLHADDLPDFGGQASFDQLGLNPARNYGLLLLVNDESTNLLSSYAAANPGGMVQVMALGQSDGGVTFGIEDTLVTDAHSDRDYNDLVVTLGFSQGTSDWLI
ncbi:right-handed parallel beta-helix repeat-containing protein [Aquabacter cavernae]|uniref:right-handed parallel beta-helix repeat-containing protein n=1 Tax=Aquabacter cavernae TaxID=2496029 RepID=UPI000F8D9D07|nr:right-handed parallel beta-helix repeat-containing protein [Aquabacter cavernae]